MKTEKLRPRVIATINSWYAIFRDEGDWFAINQALIDLSLGKCAAGNVLDFLQEIIPNAIEIERNRKIP